MSHYYKNWMEIWFFILMVVGIVISLAAPSAIISYSIIFCSGLFAGRLIYERKNKIQLPYLVIIAGFFIGYLIGAYYGSRLIGGALFVIGAILSYRAYDKGLLKDFRF